MPSLWVRQYLKVQSRPRVLHSHRHPICLFTVTAAPMIGASVGPAITHSIQIAMAIPRICGDSISPKVAGPILVAAEAKTPWKKRVTRMLAKFLLTAVPILNTPITNVAGNMAILRPYSSLSGAQIIGPSARPAQVQTNWIRNLLIVATYHRDRSRLPRMLLRY